MWPFSRSTDVRVNISQDVLTAIFDDCDQYDHVETGGRLVGTFRGGRGLQLNVTGMIDAGPQARRALTSFFQDGEYQENVFRTIETDLPEIEHLGTWHTHHVNGYPTLSGGDVQTYQRTVNHPNHNLNFWYALLVTKKVAGPERYLVRHYVLMRGDERVYEVPPSRVRVVHDKAAWIPTKEAGFLDVRAASRESSRITVDDVRQDERATDDRVLRQLFPGLSPHYSQAAKCLLWKGQMALLDNSAAGVVVVESKGNENSYEAMVAKSERLRFPGVESVSDRTPWLAAHALERQLNRHLAVTATPVRGVRDS